MRPSGPVTLSGVSLTRPGPPAKKPRVRMPTMTDVLHERALSQMRPVAASPPPAPTAETVPTPIKRGPGRPRKIRLPE